MEVLNLKEEFDEAIISDSETEEVSEAENGQTVEDIVEPIEGDNADISQLKKENEMLNDRILRMQAEFENYKRRTEKTRISDRKYQSQDIANDLLPVIDNFDRALESDVSDVNESFLEGIQIVYNQLQTALEAGGVEKIETKDQEFDPNLHHAVMQTEEPDVDSNIIVEELQKGYLLKDRVIRPAMVKVNK